MYVRVKTTPNSPRQSVQIVASYQAVDKAVFLHYLPPNKSRFSNKRINKSRDRQ